MARIAWFFMFLLAPWVLFAAPASLVALEGEVSVVRHGSLIPSEKVTEGFALEDFDTVTTGATGRAEVRLVAMTGLVGAVRLDPATSVYLEVTPWKTEQTVGVELLTGAVSVRLASLKGASALVVRTELGTFGGTARGFRVCVAAPGDVLVEATEGKVSCRVDNAQVFVEPGSVAAVSLLDPGVQAQPVNPSTLASFETTWLRTRNQTFVDQAPGYFRTLATRYQLQGGRFQRAWNRVQGEGKDDARGLSRAVANLRREASPLERSLFRVEALKKIFDTGGLDPQLELHRGYTAKDFFRQEQLDHDGWASQLATARGYYKDQEDLHGGDFPMASESRSIQYDSAYFH